MIIDLHTHSYYSPDGKLSIPELLSFYSEGDIVALTDHETIAGWFEFRDEAQNKGITPIWGVEWFLRGYCHILSYFVHEIPQAFYNFMAERRLKERDCMRLLYSRAKLQFTSIPDYEDILASKPHPESILGLAALAHHIVKESGIDFKDAVELLRDDRRTLPCCNNSLTFLPEDIIQKIHDWNGVSVLAHPFKNSHKKEGRLSYSDVQKKVRELASIGVNGVELFSDGSNLEELEYLLSLSKELNLVVSIGSDYHDQEKGLDPLTLQGIEESIKTEVKKWISH